MKQSGPDLPSASLFLSDEVLKSANATFKLIATTSVDNIKEIDIFINKRAVEYCYFFIMFHSIARAI